MSEQEAIKILKCTKKKFTVLESEINRNAAIDIAIKSLEKQVPKNWIAEYIGDGEFIWTCPSCKETFALMDGTPQDDMYNHCPNCGQALAERRSDEE